MGTLLVMTLYAPFVLAAYAAPFASRSFSELAAIAGVVWVPMLVAVAALYRYVQHEYWVLTWWGLPFVLSLPLLDAFSVGVVGQALVLASKRRHPDHEGSLRLLSLMLLAGPPIWFFFWRS